MKVALVHDYLKEYGGAERVLEALHDVFPNAPVYTSFVDFQALGPHQNKLQKWDIKTSWMDKIYPIKKLHSPLRFLAPLIWKSFDFKGFDVVISSSGWFMCKGVSVPDTTTHICYLHHPPRHLYGYATAVEWKKYLLVRIYAAVVNHFLRIYDFNTSQKVDYFIVNSKETERRCEKFYKQSSTVIYPPVDTGYENKKEKGEYYLSVSRLARAKNVDFAIKACIKHNKPLKIVGKGRDEEYLKRVAQGVSNIEFLGEVSDEELERVYNKATALIFPSVDEEFGIVSVEAQARGVPVVGLRSGGIPETLIDGKTGILFDDLTVESLTKALEKLEKAHIKSEDCVKNAKKFSKIRFEKEIKKFINTHSKKYSSS